MGVFNCLSPKIIDTPRGRRKVRCGHCDACRNTKNLSYSTQCELESQSHKYCMFVTLTYADEFIPLVSCFYQNQYTYFYPVSSRLRKHLDSPFFATSHITQFNPRSLSLFRDKFKLRKPYTDYIPVLDKRDVQDFLKRLRYYLSKETNETIRYFAAGEYGPVHFRPHYHLLIWYDKKETFYSMARCISKAWKFGRVDASLSKGKTSSYVASYTNSSSCVSRLHAIKGFRPFVLHSTFLYGQFYQVESKKIYEVEYSDVVDKGYVSYGRYKPVPPIMAFEARYFPKSLNYDQTDHRCHMVCYCLLREAQKIYGERAVSDLAEIIYRDYDGYIYQTIKTLSFDGFVNENTIKSVLYCSRKFLRLCEKYSMSEHSVCCAIEKYYSDKDYYNLKLQLSSQMALSSEWSSENRIFLLFFYDTFILQKNLPDDTPVYPKPVRDYIRSLGFEPNFVTDYFVKLENNPAYCEFADLHHKVAHDMVKHKKLNDLNKIFL